MNKAACALFAALWGMLAPQAGAIEARRLAAGEAIRVDGRIDEAAWARVPVLDRFWEVFPEAEVPARVKTEVRFAHDAHALYVAIHAHDPDPGALRAPFARRDNVLSDQDLVVVNIDPVGNRKFAHFFRVNPRGSVADGLYNEDTATEDFSPDFPFEAAAGRFAGGWTAELRIPFSSLRYGEPPSSEWSVMVFRNMPREQRIRMSTSRLPREQNCFLCLNEPLTGLDRLPGARHLEVTPNATLRATEARGGGQRDREAELVPSLDVKWRPRADLVLDATLNPDFSQVELDAPLIAGNQQFALFFPEKRPFFLEGADILEAPLRALHTRSVTDPAWGARATQRSERFDGTVMVARDDGGGLVLLPGPYGTGFALQDRASLATFARGRWQVLGATVGALATDRTLEGGAYNRVAGADLAWFPDTEHRLRAQLMGSWTTAHDAAGVLRRGAPESGHAALVDWFWRGREWDQYLNYEDVDEDFRADNGFIFQAGYRRLYSETARKFVGLWGLNEVSPYLNAEYKTDRAGNVLYQQNHFGVRLGLPRATTVWLEVRPNNLVAVREGGGLRKRDQVYAAIESNPFPWLARLFVEVAAGDRADVAGNRIGRGAFVSFQASLRPHPRAEIEYRVDDDSVSSLEDVEGSRRIIAQRVQQVLALWHFTARDSVRAIWQAVGTRRAPSLWEQPVAPREKSETLSVVYSHKRGIGTAFHVGATVSRERIPALGLRATRAELFAKASWALDLL